MGCGRVAAYKSPGGAPLLLPFFVVNAATFGRVNAYARRSLVQLKLVCWLRSWLASVLQDARYDFSLQLCALRVKLVRRYQNTTERQVLRSTQRDDDERTLWDAPSLVLVKHGTLLTYDPHSETWTESASYPSEGRYPPRMHHACVHNGRIIVFMENGSAFARAADGSWATYEGAAAVGPPVFGLLAPQHYASESVLLG